MDPVTIVYLLIAILSYLGSRKAGLSKGKSALVAAGVTGLAYKYDVGGTVVDWAGSVVPSGEEAVSLPSSSSEGGWLSKIPGNAISGAIIGGAGAAAISDPGTRKFFLWGALGLGALLILSRGD